MVASEFIGHLHPLIIHLPIGILLFAFALMLFQQFRKIEMESAISFGLLLGAISAALACGAGWLLAQSGEYDADLVFKHQWTGITTTVLGFLAYFFKPYRWFLASATVIVLTIAGHYGGNLTHGEDFLFATKDDSNGAIQKIDTAQFAVNQPINRTLDSSGTQPTVRKTFVYQDKIVPILKAKCYNCHSATKKKGGLRLDTEAFIRKGGKNGAILAVGNPLKSTLFSNLLLPLEDEKHMPPKGKSQLTAQEIGAIHYWIKQGAPFVEQTETILPQNNIAAANVDNSIPAFEGFSLPVNKTEEAPLLETEPMVQKGDAIDPAVLEKLKKQHIEIAQLGVGSSYLSANFVNVKNYSSSLIDELKDANQQLVRLRLSNQPVTDEDIKKIANFENLSRINLENTDITDAALVDLQKLKKLEQLNLYGTNITDKGIEALANCPNLKVIYLWQTKTTPEGISKLKKALPKLKVEMGGFRFAQPDTNKVK